MKLKSLEAIFSALNAVGVRYLVVGGLAVNAHGYQRLIQDLDLVVQLDAENLRRAVRALVPLGYRPVVPVDIEDIADPEKRTAWIQDKNMQVFGLVSDTYWETPLDLFVTEPFDFEAEYKAAMWGEIAPGLKVGFVTIPTLIDMKEAAGRPRDLDDIQHLRWLQEEKQKHD